MENLIEIMKPNFVYADERGKLTQLVREGYSQVNVVFSQKGAFRGGHYHKDNTEIFFVISGKFAFTARKGTEQEKRVFRTGDMFKVFPNVSHDFDYLEDTMLVSMYNKGVELPNHQMDIWKD